jgi:hypothetical protein
MDAPSPEFARVSVAQIVTGLSRSTLYRLAGEHPGLFRKLNSSTIVDLVMLRRLLTDLPPADVRPPRRSARDQRIPAA